MFWRKKHKKEHEGVAPRTKNNEAHIANSDRCGCLGCGNIFPADSVANWVEESDWRRKGPIDRTAICPHCGESLVVGDSGKYEITPTTIETMRTYLPHP